MGQIENKLKDILEILKAGGGGGGGGAAGIPNAPTDPGKYVLNVGANSGTNGGTNNVWGLETKEHYEVRLYDKSKDQDWSAGDDRYVVETTKAELQEIVEKLDSGGITVSIYTHDGDGGSELFPMCTLLKDTPREGIITLAGVHFGIQDLSDGLITSVIGLVMLAATYTTLQVMSVESFPFAYANFAKRAQVAVGADSADYANYAYNFVGAVPVSQMYKLFGKCLSNASTVAKTVSIPGYEEQEGITIFVMFDATSTALSPTLNVNQTGAYPIVVGTSSLPYGIGTLSAGVHALTLVNTGNGKHWIINEGPAAVSGTITFPENGWASISSTLYRQPIISLIPVTVRTKVDLQPDVTTLTQMQTDGTTSIFIENNNGILAAYALGAKPTADLTIQYTKTEVYI